MARNVRWSLEEHIAMIFAIKYSNKTCNGVANWLNEVFGNDRSGGAVENQLSLLRGVSLTLVQTPQQSFINNV